MQSSPASQANPLRDLSWVDWSFVNAGAPHRVHGLHSYPAKFVPELPRTVIQLLTKPGDLVLDPFAGSGTALVEALLLGRRAIGGDLNPVAVTVARAKTTRLQPEQIQGLRAVAAAADERVMTMLRENDLVLPDAWNPTAGRRFRGLGFWFSEEIGFELAALRTICSDEVDEKCRAVLNMCFSAIIVSVSWQDSDTRYVRRAKKIGQGDATRLFKRKIFETTDALTDFARRVRTSAEIHELDARSATYADAGSVSLAITSPPYPNAWSYHLYHQNRILWLGGDPWQFKEREVGHHRAYSAPEGNSREDFEQDMRESLVAINRALAKGGYAVVVVGDSVVRGEAIRNDHVLLAAARGAGLEHVETFCRAIDPRRKSFNPRIGKIRMEHVLVFQRQA